MQTASGFSRGINGRVADMLAAQTDFSLAQRYPGFHSFKSLAPVLYPRRWQRDVLVQAALDPTISAISPLPVDFGPGQLHPVEFGFVVTITQTDFALLVTEATNIDDLPEVKLPVLKLTRRSITVEPRYSTAKAIWAKKRLLVDPANRYLALEATGTSLEGISFSRVVRALCTPLPHSIDLVLAMLAQGILVADVSRGLSPTTKIRSGCAHQEVVEPRPLER